MFAYFANPERFMRISAWALPIATMLAVTLLAIGLPWGFIFAPPDFRQGESVRIMFVHVPASMWAMGIYVFMAYSLIART